MESSKLSFGIHHSINVFPPDACCLFVGPSPPTLLCPQRYSATVLQCYSATGLPSSVYYILPTTVPTRRLPRRDTGPDHGPCRHGTASNFRWWLCRPSGSPRRMTPDRVKIGESESLLVCLVASSTPYRVAVTHVSIFSFWSSSCLSEECQPSRTRTEALEVTLTGVGPSTANHSPANGSRTFYIAMHPIIVHTQYL